MYLPLGTFSPSVKLGFVSASRNCFPRSLSEARAKKLIAACQGQGIELVVPQGPCAVIESREHASEAAAQLMAAGCDAAVLFLGNFSPEIEDAQFVKDFSGCVMVLAAAEESASTLLEGRGDALCGLLSATMAIEKRSLMGRVFIPEQPLVDCARGVEEIARFIDVMKVVKGTQNMTIGLFGPRPRDFETCNYNLASILSLGIEVEELGFFDLVNEVEKVKGSANLAGIEKEMNQDVNNIPTDGFINRLSAYEQALLNLRDRLKLSGATSQCWAEQEWKLQHTPCFINGRLAGKGFRWRVKTTPIRSFPNLWDSTLRVRVSRFST
jgi:L-fucose isomerase-like protein